MTRVVYLVFFGNARFSDSPPAAVAGAPLPVVSGGSDDATPDHGDGHDDDHGHGAVATLDDFESSEPTVSFGEPPRPRGAR